VTGVARGARQTAGGRARADGQDELDDHEEPESLAPGVGSSWWMLWNEAKRTSTTAAGKEVFRLDAHMPKMIPAQSSPTVW